MEQTGLLLCHLSTCRSFGSANSITSFPAAQGRKGFHEDFVVAGDILGVSQEKRGGQASLNPWLVLSSSTPVVLVILALWSGASPSSGRELG